MNFIHLVPLPIETGMDVVADSGLSFDIAGEVVNEAIPGLHPPSNVANSRMPFGKNKYLDFIFGFPFQIVNRKCPTPSHNCNFAVHLPIQGTLILSYTCQELFTHLLVDIFDCSILAKDIQDLSKSCRLFIDRVWGKTASPGVKQIAFDRFGIRITSMYRGTPTEINKRCYDSSTRPLFPVTIDRFGKIDTSSPTEVATNGFQPYSELVI